MARTGTSMTGTQFKGGEPHEAYPKASLMRRRINEYFDECDFKNKHYTVPGLALHLGLRTKALMNYDKLHGMEHPEHQTVIDYALQRIEAHTVEMLFTTKGSTKGIEFLMQNTANYANKSDVSSKTELELTEKEKIRQLPDSELNERLKGASVRLQDYIEKKMMGG